MLTGLIKRLRCQQDGDLHGCTIESHIIETKTSSMPSPFRTRQCRRKAIRYSRFRRQIATDRAEVHGAAKSGLVLDPIDLEGRQTPSNGMADAVAVDLDSSSRRSRNTARAASIRVSPFGGDKKDVRSIGMLYRAAYRRL